MAIYKAIAGHDIWFTKLVRPMKKMERFGYNMTDIIKKGEYCLISHEVKERTTRYGAVTSKEWLEICKITDDEYYVNILFIHDHNLRFLETEVLFQIDDIFQLVTIIKSEQLVFKRLQDCIETLKPLQIVEDVLYVIKIKYLKKQLSDERFLEIMDSMEKVNKIAALAERGISGEKETALRMLTKSINKPLELLCRI